MKLLGLISPTVSEDSLIEVRKILPEGIVIEGRSMKVGGIADSEFQKVDQTFIDLVRDLAQKPLDFLMVTGDLFFAYKGPGSDRPVLAEIQKITPVPASTVLTAVTHACQALGLRRVVMAAPFVEDQTRRLAQFLEHDRIKVVAYRTLGYDNSRDIWPLSPETGYDLASVLLREFPDVDGVYMPCNKWRIVSVIERIEKDFGKPVITNTTAWVWEALRGMGLTKTVENYGRLLAEK